MNKPPAFQFYPNDFAGGTVTFSNEQCGLYIRAICIQWDAGFVTKDDFIALSSGMADPLVNRVMAKFELGQDGRFRNKRLEKVRQEQIAYREKQRHNGIASGIARAAQQHERPFNDRSTTAQPSGEPKPNSSSPSPSLSPSSPLSSTSPTKRERGCGGLEPKKKAVADHMEAALGEQWKNDAGKWINRIKSRYAICFDVVCELERAIREDRIETTPAQYAEKLWRQCCARHATGSADDDK